VSQAHDMRARPWSQVRLPRCRARPPSRPIPGLLCIIIRTVPPPNRLPHKDDTQRNRDLHASHFHHRPQDEKLQEVPFIRFNLSSYFLFTGKRAPISHTHHHLHSTGRKEKKKQTKNYGGPTMTTEFRCKSRLIILP